ncbi:MAG: hypothetical protein A2509_07020 [Candidatus Edwardsbacteria bacterium RIFOXYD12_FULL_50_11]|nr:MAG: hypothetical protein A2509_07020 [Candidatus Edwardsbacteria bacterium RIFOXYD12_FULL_50_11]
MRIVWSEPAAKDYRFVIEYILAEWGESVASEFINKVDKVIEIIIANPKVFPKSDFKNVRKVVILPQLSLFYIEEKSTVVIVRLWDNRQNPDKLKLK